MLEQWLAPRKFGTDLDLSKGVMQCRVVEFIQTVVQAQSGSSLSRSGQSCTLSCTCALYCVSPTSAVLIVVVGRWLLMALPVCRTCAGDCERQRLLWYVLSAPHVIVALFRGFPVQSAAASFLCFWLRACLCVHAQAQAPAGRDFSGSCKTCWWRLVSCTIGSPTFWRLCFPCWRLCGERARCLVDMWPW